MTDDDDIRALLDTANPVPARAVAGLAATPAARAALRRILATPGSASGPRARRRLTRRRPRGPKSRAGMARWIRLALPPVAASALVVAAIVFGGGAPDDGGRLDDPAGSMAPVAAEVFLPGLDGRPRGITSCAGPASGASRRAVTPLPPLTGYPPAGAVLSDLSRTAERQPAPERRPKERYSRIRTAEWSMDVTVGSALTSTRIVPREVRRWIPVDGSKAYVEKDSTGLKSYLIPDGIPWVARAPGDADGVRRWLLDGSRTAAAEPVEAGDTRDAGDAGAAADAGDTVGRLAEAVARVYRYNTVPPRLAGLIWQVLAARPELRALGEMADRRQRAGTAVAFDLPGERWVFVVARDTGRLLALERVLLAAPRKMYVATPCSAGYFLLDASTWTVRVGAAS
ncbi:hypothetical protein J5X84_18955 [Streptosporangiaceae bacterium NEAU-GS5]|nr:hypothetical protein [Streptosporangiaceae bacterium NEAU-GS5]